MREESAPAKETLSSLHSIAESRVPPMAASNVARLPTKAQSLARDLGYHWSPQIRDGQAVVHAADLVAADAGIQRTGDTATDVRAILRVLASAGDSDIELWSRQGVLWETRGGRDWPVKTAVQMETLILRILCVDQLECEWDSPWVSLSSGGDGAEARFREPDRHCYKIVLAMGAWPEVEERGADEIAVLPRAISRAEEIARLIARFLAAEREWLGAASELSEGIRSLGWTGSTMELVRRLPKALGYLEEMGIEGQADRGVRIGSTRRTAYFFQASQASKAPGAFESNSLPTNIDAEASRSLP
jgi:hypothetical protein